MGMREGRGCAPHNAYPKSNIVGNESAAGLTWIKPRGKWDKFALARFTTHDPPFTTFDVGPLRGPEEKK